jgi:hypothetical protein
MRRIALSLLVVAIAWAAPVAAQRSLPATADSVVVDSAVDSFADSLGIARRAGAAAAGHRGVVGYFTAAFVSGLALGIAAPIVCDESTPDAAPALVSLVGAGGFVAATARAARSDVVVPPEDASRLERHDAEYQHAFRRAYEERLHARRTHAALWGGVVGATVGVGALVLLLSNIKT